LGFNLDYSIVLHHILLVAQVSKKNNIQMIAYIIFLDSNPMLLVGKWFWWFEIW